MTGTPLMHQDIVQTRHRRRLILVAFVMLIGGIWSPLSAADINLSREKQAKVDQALKDSIAWLKINGTSDGSAEGSLVGYALVKAGVSVQEPIIQKQLRAVLTKMETGAYGTNGKPRHFIYEAGCDAMFLEAVDAVGYRVQLSYIGEFIVRNQQPTGSWFYPELPSGNAGDTSITQYAILGLWAIQRAGIDVPPETWGRAAKFLQSTQKENGRFSYHPYENIEPTASMTVAGLGTAMVLRIMLYSAVDDAPKAEPPSRRRFGVLEQAREPEDPQGEAKRKAAAAETITRDQFKTMISRGEAQVDAMFQLGLTGPHPIYFLYGCERAGALKNSGVIGNVAWYDQGVDYLLQRQATSGAWRISGIYAGDVDTSFAILFLSRATKSIVPRARPPRKIAGGLLAGGRGLPTDLNAVNVVDGNVKPVVPKGAVDTLLTELEQPSEVTLAATPQQILEQINLDDPQALVGQIDRLRKLLNHPQPEVRQVVVWALARSGDYRMTPHLIALLDDPDVIVAWEASLGLCVLARMPGGITPEGKKEPLPIAPPGAISGEADPTIKDWRALHRAAWDAWYQQVRPYDERDDVRQIRNK
jgi:hypothetical protein